MEDILVFCVVCLFLMILNFSVEKFKSLIPVLRFIAISQGLLDENAGRLDVTLYPAGYQKQGGKEYYKYSNSAYNRTEIRKFKQKPGGSKYHTKRRLLNDNSGRVEETLYPVRLQNQGGKEYCKDSDLAHKRAENRKFKQKSKR